VTAPIRVLVCDDQMLIHTGLVTIIDAQPDLEVVGECGNGQAAVDLAGRLAPHVVVMEIRMPVIDGIEATRLLAGAGVPQPVKVVVLTTFNLDEYVYEALRAGATGFLLKDAPPAQLLHGIRIAATGAALLNPEVTRQFVGRFAARIRPAAGDSPRDTPLAGTEPVTQQSARGPARQALPGCERPASAHDLLPAAFAAARNAAGQVLLIRRLDDGIWELAGGRIEGGLRTDSYVEPSPSQSS
jgi:DNA-binding NarL/FixJ family response regulator